MQTDATSAPERNLIEATVTIQRPVNEVFGFYRDFKNLPSFLGDVMAIEPICSTTWRWTVAHCCGGATGNKVIAEIRLAHGKFTTKPLQKLSESDSRIIRCILTDLRLAAVTEPAEDSYEARLGRAEQSADALSNELDDLDILPELAEGLFDVASKVREAREKLRLLRAA